MKATAPTERRHEGTKRPCGVLGDRHQPHLPPAISRGVARARGPPRRRRLSHWACSMDIPAAAFPSRREVSVIPVEFGDAHDVEDCRKSMAREHTSKPSGITPATVHATAPLAFAVPLPDTLADDPGI